MMTIDQAKEKLEKYGQSHVLKYYEKLSDDAKASFLEQIEDTDFEIIDSINHKEELNPKGEITPLAALRLSAIEKKRDEYTEIGIEAIKAGKVGAVLLAGGMGTRLGSDDPKGMFNIGLTKDVYIFQRLFENLMDVVVQCEATVPLFIMTSEKNHDKTVEFLKSKSYFGYDPNMIWFFKQDMAPAVDYDGKLFLEAKGRISTSPNGNGGWFSSMEKAGLTEKLHEMGIEWLNIFAVDNVLQRIADPCFVGATISFRSACGSKVVKKASPDEKVGVMCLEDGKPSIVEYYELTDELREAKDEKGEPAYNFGVILNYLFNVKALEEIVANKLPLHIVEKKIDHLNEAGYVVKPEAPNGYKFEQLVLDMIHELDSCLPFEVVREKEFAPIKNRNGVDSVESARELCKKNGIVL